MPTTLKCSALVIVNFTRYFGRVYFVMVETGDLATLEKIENRAIRENCHSAVRRAHSTTSSAPIGARSRAGCQPPSQAGQNRWATLCTVSVALPDMTVRGIITIPIISPVFLQNSLPSFHSAWVLSHQSKPPLITSIGTSLHLLSLLLQL
jgi:hypothetical protein